jgi:hypothetical protein
VPLPGLWREENRGSKKGNSYTLKLAYIEPIMRLAISITIYAVIGLSLDLLQSHARSRTL